MSVKSLTADAESKPIAKAEQTRTEDSLLVELLDTDPENPRNWSSLRKWAIVGLLLGLSLTSNLVILMVAPAAPQILAEFHSTDQLYATLLVSIWTLGGVCGPLLVGPLTELYGRRIVYNIANTLFVVFCVAGAESTSISMTVAFRFLNGLAIASTTLNPSIIGDIFVVEQRGRAQSLLTVLPLLGPICGPIIGGFVSEDLGWRWTYWLAAIMVGILEFAFLFLYKETYEPKLLRAKAEQLRVSTGDKRFYSKYDHRDPPLKVFRKGMITPFRVFKMPVFLALAGAVSLIYGYIYFTVTTLTEVFESTYGFPEEYAGLAFLGIASGMTIGVFACGATLDWYTKKMKKRYSGVVKPEWRLPMMAVGAVIVPIGLFLYGWTAEFHLHFMVPIVGTALLGFGIDAIMIPATTYLTDVFTLYRASAMASLTVTRNIVSTVLPLAGPPMYQHIGLGWGNSVLGFVALATAPIPFLLIRYGERMRQASKL